MKTLEKNVFFLVFVDDEAMTGGVHLIQRVVKVENRFIALQLTTHCELLCPDL